MAAIHAKLASHASQRPRRAFTLIELMVVLIIISLIAVTVLPSVVGIFQAGTDSQAHNMFVAQLTAARVLAVTKGVYTAVHVQRAADETELGNVWFLAVMEAEWYDPTPVNPGSGDEFWRLKLADGYQPRRIPGDMAFGELSRFHVVPSGSTPPYYQNITGSVGGVGAPEYVDYFTTFSIVFAPSGGVVKFIDRAEPQVLNTSADTMFYNDSANENYLWDPELVNLDISDGSYNGEAGATAVVMFDYSDFAEIEDTDEARSAFLQINGALIPVNLYTGLAMDRE